MRISDWSSDVCSSDLPHGKAIRQDNAGMFRRIQHFEQNRLLAVVRASRVARRGADASILFADQRFIRELLALRIAPKRGTDVLMRSEEHTSELQSLMRISYAVFCLKKNKIDSTKIQT